QYGAQKLRRDAERSFSNFWAEWCPKILPRRGARATTVKKVKKVKKSQEAPKYRHRPQDTQKGQKGQKVRHPLTGAKKVAGACSRGDRPRPPIAKATCRNVGNVGNSRLAGVVHVSRDTIASSRLWRSTEWVCPVPSRPTCRFHRPRRPACASSPHGGA